MKGEGKYRALYDDIVASKETWMTLFDERGNVLQAEHTSALLVNMLSDSRQLKLEQLARSLAFKAAVTH
jgi:hypothetical protein